MARSKSIRAPTTASLPSTLYIPSTSPSVSKSFNKLSRQALLDLVFQWLDDNNVESFPPYLERDQVENTDPDDEETSPYPAEQTIDDVRNAYQDLQDRKGGKREVIDRVLEGDWRHGITLRQLAMVDICYMEDHPASLRWTALELARLDGVEDTQTDDVSVCLPRIHASTFLKNLQQLIAPLVKAHYHLARSNSLPLTFLRILVTNSPYQHPRQQPEVLMDSSRVIYIAFPDSCPYIYTSISSAGSKTSTSATTAVGTDTRSLQRIVRDAIPKALSRPQERYTLKATSLSAKSLQALLSLRGPSRSNAANGAFSIFADAVVEGSPLDPRPANTVLPGEYMNRREDGKENERTEDGDTKNADTHIPKKRKLAVHSRFGTSGSLSSAPLDRFDVRILDSPSGRDNQEPSEDSQPTLSLTFAGNDVISGIRKLAELGIVDAERMPSWMTGEEGVSVAVVHQGKRVTKDSG
ncbi:CENP-N/CHL4 family protein [Aspergillus ruber CBS 135680]|uniref:CHL4 family chromosome segregation protein n=1 Tax=Aspergillus ruber (strain CBS 135680) TaxID=1388766 RepID=A0A017SM44_ASPRC|nr:CHL4 family chromosome segregation protein [Aspergillus ruber CBS 135680]EYE97856.1 CHL4 family chromosome segregation protein [Aspergillus ruber CBS 135680]